MKLKFQKLLQESIVGFTHFPLQKICEDQVKIHKMFYGRFSSHLEIERRCELDVDIFQKALNLHKANIMDGKLVFCNICFVMMMISSSRILIQTSFWSFKKE